MDCHQPEWQGRGHLNGTKSKQMGIWQELHPNKEKVNREVKRPAANRFKHTQILTPECVKSHCLRPWWSAPPLQQAQEKSVTVAATVAAAAATPSGDPGT